MWCKGGEKVWLCGHYQIRGKKLVKAKACMRKTLVLGHCKLFFHEEEEDGEEGQEESKMKRLY